MLQSELSCSVLTDHSAPPPARCQVYMRAALLSVSARHPAFTEAQCWHALFARYCEAWAQLHAPLALAAAPGGGGAPWLGVVRGGLMFSLLRPATRLEDEESPGSAAAGSRAHAAVRSCLTAIGQAVGGPALRLMMRLVAAGVDLEGRLLPAMVDLLMYGPQQGEGAHGGATAAAGARRRLAEWRAARQGTLLHVQQALDALPDPVAAIRWGAELPLLTTWSRCASCSHRDMGPCLLAPHGVFDSAPPSTLPPTLVPTPCPALLQ
jgi:hypothetical protein